MLPAPRAFDIANHLAEWQGLIVIDLLYRNHQYQTSIGQLVSWIFE